MRNISAYFWGLVTRIAPAVLQLVTTMVLSRILTPEDFGIIGVTAIIFAVANVLVDSGLGGSLINENSLSNVDCSTISIFNIVIGILLFAVVFVIAPIIERFYSIEGLATIIRWLSLTFLLGPIGLVPKSLLMRELNFKHICFITLFSIIISSVFAIVLALLDFGVYALVIYQISQSLFTSLGCVVLSNYRFSIAFSFSSLKRLLPFGIFTTISSVIDTLYENLLTSLTGKYLNVTDAGYLNQAKKIEEMLCTAIASTIGNVSFPIISRLRDKRDVFLSESFSVLRSVILFTYPLLVVTSLYSDNIINILFGPQWQNSSYYLRLLVLAGAFVIVETTIRSFIKSFNKTKELMLITVVKRVIGVIIIVVSLLVSPKFLIYGYVVSSAVALLCNSITFNQLLNIRLCDVIKGVWKTVLTIILLGVVMALPLVCFSSTTISISISVIVLIVYYIILTKELFAKR